MPNFQSKKGVAEKKRIGCTKNRVKPIQKKTETYVSKLKPVGVWRWENCITEEGGKNDGARKETNPQTHNPRPSRKPKKKLVKQEGKKKKRNELAGRKKCRGKSKGEDGVSTDSQTPYVIRGGAGTKQKK